MTQIYLQNLKRKGKTIAGCSHKKEIVDNVTGEVICNLCGQVLKEKINSDPSDSGFGSHEDWLNNSHHGSGNPLSSQMSLSTTIDKSQLDYSGKSLPHNNNLDFHRLRKWDRIAKTPHTNNFKAAFALLDGVTAKLHLPLNIQERTAYLYRKASKEGIIRGRGIPSVLAASIYLACRSENAPRSMSEICKSVNIQQKSLYRTLSKFTKTMNVTPEIRKPTDYLPSLCSKIQCSEKTKRHGYEILGQIEKHSAFIGRNPLVVCATALWLALNQSTSLMTQTTFCESCGISSVSLRNTLKFIRKIKLVEIYF